MKFFTLHPAIQEKWARKRIARAGGSTEDFALAGVSLPTLGGIPITSPERWNAYRAKLVPAIYRARTMTAGVLASLPIVDRDTGEPIGSPNVETSRREIVTETVLAMLDGPEAYWWLRGTGPEVIPTRFMNVEWNETQTRRVYRLNLPGRGELRMRPSGAVQRNLAVLPLDRGAEDLTGTGPMQSRRIEGLIAEQAYSQDFFENHARPGGKLTIPGRGTAQQAAQMLADWEAAQIGRKTAAMFGGIEYEADSFSPSDSDWVNTHLTGILDVAQLFFMPSSLLGYNAPGSSVTYENVGNVYEGWWRQGLGPMFGEPIAETLSEITGRALTFDPEQLFLADLETRVDSAAKLVQAGYDPADALDKVGLPEMRHSGLIPTTLYQEPSEVTT